MDAKIVACKIDQPAEFIGLTEAEARELRHKKDVAYLRS